MENSKRTRIPLEDDDTFIIKLTYLAVYFDEINKLNLSLQRNVVNILSAKDKIASFLRNLQLYQRRVQAISVPSQLTTLLEGTEEKCPFAGDVMQLLYSTEESTSGHFPDLELREKNTWIMIPFSVEERVVKDDGVTAKAEFLGLREGNTLKADFQYSHLATFWHKLIRDIQFSQTKP